MQDTTGIYYYPNPADKLERMYVREQDGVIQFRLWHQKYPDIWEKHNWLDIDIIKRAADLMKNKNSSNPLALYDIETAKYLLASKK